MSIELPKPLSDVACQTLLANTVKYHGHLRRRKFINKLENILGSHILKWSRNYVVIHKGCLYCYKNESDLKPSKTCSLYGFVKVEECKGPDCVSGPLWSFKVIHGLFDESQSIFFSAATSEDMTKWVKVFNEEILAANKVCYETNEIINRPLPKPVETDLGNQIEVFNSDSDSSSYEEIYYDGFEDEGNATSRKSKTNDSMGLPKTTSPTSPLEIKSNKPPLEVKSKPKVLPKPLNKVKLYNKVSEDHSCDYELYEIEGLWSDERGDEGEMKLRDQPIGSFMLRSSKSTSNSSKTLLVKQCDRSLKKYRIHQIDSSFALIENAQDDHKQPNIPALLKFYKENNLPNANFKLGKPMEAI